MAVMRTMEEWERDIKKLKAITDEALDKAVGSAKILVHQLEITREGLDRIIEKILGDPEHDRDGNPKVQ